MPLGIAVVLEIFVERRALACKVFFLGYCAVSTFLNYVTSSLYSSPVLLGSSSIRNVLVKLYWIFCVFIVDGSKGYMRHEFRSYSSILRFDSYWRYFLVVEWLVISFSPWSTSFT